MWQTRLLVNPVLNPAAFRRKGQSPLRSSNTSRNRRFAAPTGTCPETMGILHMSCKSRFLIPIYITKLYIRSFGLYPTLTQAGQVVHQCAQQLPESQVPPVQLAGDNSKEHPCC